MEKKSCYFCSKKIGILSFECRCNYSFCSKHRFPETHKCTFDHRGYDRKILKENINIDCNFKKIERI